MLLNIVGPNIEENTEHLETKPVYGGDVNAMEFKYLKDSILNLEREAFIVYTNLCTQEAHNTRPATTQLHPLELWTESNQEDRLHNINALLKGAEIEEEAAQQHELVLRSGRPIRQALPTVDPYVLR